MKLNLLCMYSLSIIKYVAEAFFTLSPMNQWFEAHKQTRVVKLKRMRGKIIQNCEVYIGRAYHQGGWKFPASPFANPFLVEQYGRAESIRRYEAHLRSHPELMAQLPALKGKILGCWCHPLPCHGDVLVKLIQEQT